MTTTSQKRAFAFAMSEAEDMLEKAIAWITDEFAPEELYPEEALEAWAKKRGYGLIWLEVGARNIDPE